MSKQGYIAFDLGAESGRAMLAVLDGEHLTLEEGHRFANVPVNLPSGLHWNLPGLWANLVDGLRKCGRIAKERGIEVVSLGVDTWGVDYGLLGPSGQLLMLPFAYRDPRNLKAMKKSLRALGEQAVYDRTGIQFMPFNTLFQLVAQKDSEPQTLKHAHRLLHIPDLLHYFFTGKAVSEATIASTSQMIDPTRGRCGAWDTAMLRRLGLPAAMLGRIVPAGTRIGRLRRAVAAEADVPVMDVIAPGCHDTASAVAAVPVDASVAPASGGWAYLSSGTWSLMGVELVKPLISQKTRQLGFTNERGVGGGIRFLKNIAGLWLVQECRRDFARTGNDYDYGKLTELASQAPPFRTLVDPAHAPFGSPGDMPAKIAAFAKATRQPEPESPGQFVRCCLESLAMTYRHTLDGIQSLLGREIAVLHIVGGGGRNGLLNQMTADALARPVIVGPFEATAVGNALTQAIGTRQVRGLDHLRAIVRASFSPERYEPTGQAAFEAQRTRFQSLLGR